MRKMLNQKESNYNRLRRAKMDKSMFVKIKTLGIGAFGEVCLTRKVDTSALYAMKTLRKKDVLNRNQVDTVVPNLWVGTPGGVSRYAARFADLKAVDIWLCVLHCEKLCQMV